MIYLTGFLLGFMGSLHCIGMCGPIALALPVPVNLNRGIAVLLYNLGRVLTYSAIGLGFGLLGWIFVLAGFQQYLSIACGVAVILMVILSRFGIMNTNASNSFTSKIRSQFAILVKKHGLVPFVLLGMLNGLLPCGLVYMSLAGATSTGGAWQGAAYMALFGLGTVPAMFAVGYLHRFLSLPWRFKVRNYVSGFVIVTGLLLILRGMNLGIPYLSPQMTVSGVSCCNKKCH